jgi:Glycosyltransferase family 87
MKMPRARWLLIGALAMHAVLGLRYASESAEPAFDFDRYYEIARTPANARAEHPAEQPIAAVAVFRALAHLPGGRAGFGLGIVALNLLADALIVAALLWGWGEVAACTYALAVIPVVDLFFNRIDPWSVGAATLAVAAWRRDRPRLAGVALAVGAAFKLWPLVLAGLLIAPPPNATGRFRRAALATFIVTGAALGAGGLLFAGGRGLVQILTFRGASGWEIESAIGSVIHLVGAIPRFESGAWRVGVLLGFVSIAMFVVAAPLSTGGAWLAARANRVGAGWLAAVAILLLLSALLSAQYLIWLAPAAGIAWTEGDRVSPLLTALAIFLTGVLWAAFPAVIAGHPGALAVVCARNAVLLAIAVSASSRFVQRRRHGLAQ